jgi:hypothetical protein
MPKNYSTLKKTTLLFAAAVSVPLAAFCYLTFIQTPNLSKREFLFAMLIWAMLLPMVYILLERFLLPIFHDHRPRDLIFWLLISALFGLLIVNTTHQSYFYLLLPKHSLKIVVPQAEGPQAESRSITLRWLTTDLGDVSFSLLQKEGDWQITESGLTHTGSSPASLFWQGRVGSSSRIDFQNAPKAGKVDVTWDGEKIVTDLKNNNPDLLIYPISFEFHPVNLFIVHFLIWFVFTFLFMTITLFLVHGRIQKRSNVSKGKFYWLLYSLPMIIIWGIYLLTFFPGIMTPDSINQWGQVVSGQFNDAHPVFHTLIMWLLTRIWFSPAIIGSVQIVFLSLVVAWGISILDWKGLPDWASWLLVIIFSLSPVNGNMVITLWKDLPYSISIFLFSLLILKVVLSKGVFLQSRISWVLLGLTGFCIASLRHNGFPIPFISLLALFLVYHSKWRSLLLAGALFLGLWVFIQVPIFNLIGAEKKAGSFEQILVHHIAAHMVAGENLTPEEQKLANIIVPSGEWQYNCCSNVYTMASLGYSDTRNAENSFAILKLFWSLAIREPLVEINHQKCVSSVVWALPSKCGLYWLNPKSQTSWIDTNSYQLQENSQLKSLLPFLSSLLIGMKSDPTSIVLISPSLYLFFLIFVLIFFSVKQHEKKIYLFGLPAIIQSFTILFISLSSDFRYQYCVYLVGVFSIGLFLLSFVINENEPRHNVEVIPDLHQG